jgi:hypothetical protein
VHGLLKTKNFLFQFTSEGDYLLFNFESHLVFEISDPILLFKKGIIQTWNYESP